jgi:endogenous inhibitor of DNA gyrase (YacG/DUF329 family)
MASRTVTCPTCQRKVAWSPDSPFRPFCSERCRLIDLGAWVSEERSIPGDEDLPTERDGSADPGAGGSDLRDDRNSQH